MRVYKSIHEIPKLKQTVLTIGSFDGLHLGHQKILQRVKMKAKENDYESVVVTFDPHPRLILSPAERDFKLLSVDNEKVKLFEKMGIDHLVIYPFTFEFSRLSPIEYIEDFLVKYFQPTIIIIGYDHRFGLNRSGDIYFLKKMSKKYGFKVIQIEKQEVEEIGISSTRIRRAIADGDIELARSFSNHNYKITGKVINGYKYGRKLGFPTANLRVAKEKLLPGDGVYAVRVDLEGDVFNGMMYIGLKPSFDDHFERVIEVHIFDFNFDIYGSSIQVELIQLIRKSQKFDSFNALQEQLLLDRKTSIELLEKQELAEQSNGPSIAIVILNYNGKEYLEEYLPSVIHPSSLNIRYIVADNGSTDDSLKFIKYYYPEIEIHEMDNNYGFSEGYNRVMKSIGNYDYVVFLNSDVETDPNWLDPIIDLMENDKRIGAAQPKILSYDEKENFEYAGAAGGYIDILAYPFCRGRVFETIEKDEAQYDDTTEVFWTSGAAMVMRKKLFDGIGGFDADFFAHQEEIDLCWRIKRAGYKVMAVGESQVYHLGGGTLSYVNPKKYYLNFRNNLTMMLKNDTGFNILWKFPARLILDGLAAFKFLIDGKPKTTLAVLKAHLHIYRNFSKIYKKRKQQQRKIDKLSIGSERVAGRYNGFIILDYFIRNKKKFSVLK
jgi:riboflavin kinase/FMN adenylyltransferase